MRHFQDSESDTNGGLFRSYSHAEGRQGIAGSIQSRIAHSITSHSITRAHSISESDQGCAIVTMLRRVNVHEFQDEPGEAIERP